MGSSLGKKKKKTQIIQKKDQQQANQQQNPENKDQENEKEQNNSPQKLQLMNIEGDKKIESEENKPKQDEEFVQLSIKRNSEKNLNKLQLSQNKSQLQALQQDGKLDLPEMKQEDDADHISFKDGEQSPILDEKSEKAKLEKLMNKIAQVSLNLKIVQSRPQTQFPKQGTCRIIKSQFKYNYSIQEKQLKLIQNYDIYTTSKLMWKFNEQLQVYDFILQDEESYDVKSSTSYKLPYNIVQFLVNQQGQYIGIKDEDDLCRKHRLITQQISSNNSQGQQNQAQQKSKQKVEYKKNSINNLIQQTELALKKLWDQSMESWQNRQLLEREKQIVGNVELNGSKCIVASKLDQKDPQQMQEYLTQQLENEDFFKACFNSKKVIKDSLKQWQIVDEQDDYLEKNDQGSLGIFKKKFRFPCLQKYEIVGAVIDEELMKPQVITTDTCKNIVIEHNRDLYVDVDQELKLYVFIWNELNVELNESFFLSELSKFKDICDSALKKTVVDLSYVSNLPLKFRTKVKPQYFTIR